MTAEGVVLRDVGRVLKQMGETGVVRRNAGRRGVSRGDPAGTPDYTGHMWGGCAVATRAPSSARPRGGRARGRSGNAIAWPLRYDSLMTAREMVGLVCSPTPEPMWRKRLPCIIGIAGGRGRSGTGRGSSPVSN